MQRLSVHRPDGGAPEFALSSCPPICLHPQAGPRARRPGRLQPQAVSAGNGPAHVGGTGQPAGVGMWLPLVCVVAQMYRIFSKMTFGQDLPFWCEPSLQRSLVRGPDPERSHADPSLGRDLLRDSEAGPGGGCPCAWLPTGSSAPGNYKPPLEKYKLLADLTLFYFHIHCLAYSGLE